MRVLLILNPGSATFKFEFFRPGRQWRGPALSRPGGRRRARQRPAADRADQRQQRGGRSPDPAGQPPGRAGGGVCLCPQHGYTLAAVTHRIVHGGPFFQRAVRIDADVIAKLQTLTFAGAAAPAGGAGGIAAVARPTRTSPRSPALTPRFTPQDRWRTLCHRPALALFAGVRRYCSFHGLSYAAIAHRLPGVVGPELADWGEGGGAASGSGSSACILHRRQSVANSTGMSAVEGLMMGARPAISTRKWCCGGWKTPAWTSPPCAVSCTRPAGCWACRAFLPICASCWPPANRPPRWRWSCIATARA